MKRKVLVVPYVPASATRKTRFLVAQDRATGDWTFISGTCEAYEAPIRCALRELYEETKGLMRLTQLPRNTRHFRFHEDDKRVDVYFIPLAYSPSRMAHVVRAFDRRRGEFPREFFENAKIRFETIAQFCRHKNVWCFIRRVIQLPQFRHVLNSANDFNHTGSC